MSTVITVVMLLLIACLLLGAVGTTLAFLVWLWRWTRRTDVYEPAASDPVEKAYASVGDTFGFNTDDGPLFAAQVESMVRRAGDGEDVYDGAPKEQT